MKKRLRIAIQTTLKKCFDQGALVETSIPDYVIEVPKNPDHGHFASNIALTLASSQKRPPMQIASIVLERLSDRQDLIETADVAKPGFINFRIKTDRWHDILSDILNLGEGYGRNDLGRGQSILVEFVSANPTGPLHLGHGRGAALGDTLCRTLAFCGYEIVREFYVNDAGYQIRLLGQSVYSRFRQMEDPDYPFPEDGYHGDYILELARDLATEKDLNAMSEEDAIEFCAERGKEFMLQDIRRDLARFRTEFDVWCSEMEMHLSGRLQAALDAFQGRGHLYEKDGAVWIRTSRFGDDKDRVIRKTDGQYTYFASDIAYHLQKKERGFTKAVNLWGADHHGYIPRIQAALRANDVPSDWLSVMLIQLVKLWKGGREFKMSKRAGSYVTLQELMDEVGVDAVRFVFLVKHHNTPLDFDIDLVKKQDSENPVYYVQYAHARLSSVFRKAAEQGIVMEEPDRPVFQRLVLDEELELIRLMAEFPPLLEDIARSLEPHRLTYYLTELAGIFHRYFNLGNKLPEHRIISSDPELTQARLLLAKAVRLVLANGLHLLGVSAPERM